MGNSFFPGGLSRVLALIGRKQVSQGCQAGPVDLNLLRQEADASSRPETKDVHVQVAGGVDADDEPLMEQQVRGRGQSLLDSAHGSLVDCISLENSRLVLEESGVAQHEEPGLRDFEAG